MAQSTQNTAGEVFKSFNAIETANFVINLHRKRIKKFVMTELNKETENYCLSERERMKEALDLYFSLPNNLRMLSVIKRTAYYSGGTYHKLIDRLT